MLVRACLCFCLLCFFVCVFSDVRCCVVFPLFWSMFAFDVVLFCVVCLKSWFGRVSLCLFLCFVGLLFVVFV